MNTAVQEPGPFARLMLSVDMVAIVETRKWPRSTVYSWRSGALPSRSSLPDIAKASGLSLKALQEDRTAEMALRRARRKPRSRTALTTR